ncbi:alpha/beta hydrolase [Streptomyces yaizuensis]|uniref:Alpha/beta hydrolase family protein n=1 Tax=Streptomyces yaizuensis TaxID=2989713 RepID=A0ABQ5P139_9ACTN|nr:alpha/beta hydrolase [Streptomyces sp. YSPA8]GLF96313.1 alpha/beta hydrolase family protein [Streptomyces sp. YSPA8]
MPHRPRRHPLRALLAALLTASVALPVAAAAGPAAVPAPAPAPLTPLERATPAALDARYGAVRTGIRAAERAAAGHGDHRRARTLRELAAPERTFLTFDGRDGGRTAEVVGDLARAERVAVLVPGADTSLDTYGRFHRDAAALGRALPARSAVVAWLGYRTPATVSPGTLTREHAERGAPALRAFVRDLARAVPAARISLACHSYGTVVCASAAPGLPAAHLVLYGSPGTGADHSDQLRTPATVWAGRGAADWIAAVPHTTLDLPFATVGFGTDPVSGAFGARVFDAGRAGHADYLRPRSLSLANIARIVSDRSPRPESRDV